MQQSVVALGCSNHHLRRQPLPLVHVVGDESESILELPIYRYLAVGARFVVAHATVPGRDQRRQSISTVSDIELQIDEQEQGEQNAGYTEADYDTFSQFHNYSKNARHETGEAAAAALGARELSAKIYTRGLFSVDVWMVFRYSIIYDLL